MGSGYKYVTLQEVHRIPDAIKKGDVVKITRPDPNKSWTTPLYIRQHLVLQSEKLDEFLARGDICKLYVTGAPGCGKTCFFWMWACMLMKKGKSIFFLQYQEDAQSMIWIFEHLTMKQLLLPSEP